MSFPEEILTFQQNVLTFLKKYWHLAELLQQYHRWGDLLRQLFLVSNHSWGDLLRQLFLGLVSLVELVSSVNLV